MSADMIAGTHTRLEFLANGVKTLSRATEPLNTAADLVAGTGMMSDSYPDELKAMSTLVYAQLERLTRVAQDCARQLGWQVATYDIAPLARRSGEEPVVFITGNSMMPPLREFGYSNAVWNLERGDLWEAYSEGVEERLTEMRVYLAAPEYDNSLYVVDLARFEYVEDAEGDNLSDEWRRIAEGE